MKFIAFLFILLFCFQLQAATYPPNCASDGSHAEVYNTALNQWTCVSVTGGGGGSSALSAITSATATNTIDNSNFNQTWTWNSLSTQTAFSLTTSSLTTGVLHSLQSTSTNASGGVLSILNATTSNGYGLKSTVTGASNSGYAGFFNNTATTGWSIYSPGAAPSYFGGALGAGTSTPAYALDVKASNTAEVGNTIASFQNSSAGQRIYITDETSSGSIPPKILGPSGDGIGFGTSSSGPVIFYSNNSEAMRINSSGRLGIGTTSLTSLVTLGIGTGGINIENNNAGNGLILQGDGNPVTNTAYLRIVDNTPIWTDSQRAAYFQINDSNGHRAVFNSGVFGADVPFDRLTFASKLTSFSDNSSVSALPVPTALVDIIGSTTSVTDLIVQGAAAQSVDYMQVLSSTSSVLAKVTSSGNAVYSGTVTDGTAQLIDTCNGGLTNSAGVCSLAATGGNGSGAEQTVSYQPGLLTAVTSTKSVFSKFVKSSTVDNIEGSAYLFSCVSNPTITLYECGTDVNCATSPVTIGSVTVTAAGAAVDGTISNAAITAGHYIAWALSAGTCTSLDISANAQIHAN